MNLSTKYDGIFGKHAGPIPVPYLRSLAYHESGFNPAAKHPRSSATGLFQVTAIALTDYNRRHGASLALSNLADPETSTKVAVSHLTNLLGRYGSAPSLKVDWKSRRFAELLTLGWNSGHNAVVQLARALEAQGISPERITVDTVSQLAARLKTPYVSDPARVAWAKRVAGVYLGQPVGPGRPSVSSVFRPVLPSAVGPVLVAAALVGGAVVGAYALSADRPRRVPA
jgi:membrane-bound lytic murein transglycosylase MltF